MGLLHHKKSQPKYNLRRYFPNPPFEQLIEQFWFVDWELKAGLSHKQQNLPDPNFHLIIDNGKIKLIGPVSKVYTYKMLGKGSLFGIKFHTGALTHFLNALIFEYLDKEFDAQDVLALDVNDNIQIFNTQVSDERLVEYLQVLIQPLISVPCPNK